MTIKTLLYAAFIFQVTFALNLESMVFNSAKVEVVQRDTPGSYDVQRVNASSDVHCALLCLSRPAPCRTYKYNSSTSECSLAVNPAAVMTTSTDTLMVSGISTDELAIYEQTVHNILDFTAAPTDYVAATQVCAKANATMFSANTWEKFQILISKQKSDKTWAGLDDLEEEGTYRWTSDGSVAFSRQAGKTDIAVAHEAMPGFWASNKPTGRDTQDCVILRERENLLRDRECYGNFGFLCEKQLTLF